MLADRLASVDARIRHAAGALSVIFAEEYAECYALVVYHVTLRALRDDTLLSQTDSYIVCFGTWRARSELVRRWRHIPLPLDDVAVESPDADLPIALSQVAGVMAGDAARAMRTMSARPDDYIIGVRVNVSALARALGVSWEAARRALDDVRDTLVSEGITT